MLPSLRTRRVFSVGSAADGAGCGLVQVDVTAADSVGQGQIPAVNTAAAASAQATGMINTALQHMGLGPDPWKAIKVGVRRPSSTAHVPPCDPAPLECSFSLDGKRVAVVHGRLIWLLWPL